MHITGIIPARYASSRFPGKPLLDLKGKSMIQRVYEGASAATLLSQVIVATDDVRIAEHVRSFGGKVQMTSSSHSTGTDRCGEVACDLKTDIVVNIQGDEPLVDHRQIDQLCAAFQDETVLIATLGILINEKKEDLINPNRIKVVCKANGDALYFSRSSIPYERVDKNFPFLRHIGLYAYRKEVLLQLTGLTPALIEETESLEQLRWLYNGYAIRVIQTDIETPNIDSPEDVDEVLRLL